MERETGDIGAEVNSQEDNARLRERNAYLEGKVIEYELRLRINQPPQEMILGEYLSKLKDPLERKKIIGKNEGIVITDVRVADYSFKYDYLVLGLMQGMPIVGIPFLIGEIFGRGALNYVSVTLSDDKGNKVKFKHFCHKDVHPTVKKILDSYVGRNTSKVLVRSTSSRNHFIEGFVLADNYLKL
ncbi:hypothetical protein KY343_03285 [Candidatus Woesearchaeota archaeon]|nr:hypothetical protein [Candidatus Woesearchaeota archaeon]